MKIALFVATAMCVSPALAQTGPTPPTDPVGGYQPDHPALSEPVPPGTPVIFQQAPSPDVAYPAPPPLAHYPVCRRGQFDKCIQRNSPK